MLITQLTGICRDPRPCVCGVTVWELQRTGARIVRKDARRSAGRAGQHTVRVSAPRAGNEELVPNVG